MTKMPMQSLMQFQRRSNSYSQVMEQMSSVKRSEFEADTSTASGTESTDEFSPASSDTRTTTPRPHLADLPQEKGTKGPRSFWSNVSISTSAEIKVLLNRILEAILILPAIRLAFITTSLATYRHETAHQFANRNGIFSGPNDANNHPFGTDLDHLRLRDAGFELIPEEHSEAMATIIDIIPPFIGIFVFLPMFIGAVTRKFNINRRKERMYMSMIVDGCVLMSIMISARSVFFLSTALPAPDRECVRGLRDYNPNSTPASNAEGLHHNPTCGDLIYSGHFSTSYAFLMFYYTESHRFFKGESKLGKFFRVGWGCLLALVIACQVYGIIATRHHYTIDILFVPVFDFFVRNAILPTFGIGSGRLENRSAILYSDFVGLRALGNSYQKMDRDPRHAGPSERFKKFGIFVFFAVIIGCSIAVALIAHTMLSKLQLKCASPTLRGDWYCNFANNYVREMPNFEL